jgi:hypothetical protein
MCANAQIDEWQTTNILYSGMQLCMSSEFLKIFTFLECRKPNILLVFCLLKPVTEAIFQFTNSTKRGTIMIAKLFLRMCAVVLGAAMCLQTTAVMAEIVTTDQMAVQNQAEAEKSKVQAFIDRADVKVSLQALGVNELSAKDRVAAMTDQEVHAMAQKITSMPAGGALSDRDLVLILLVVLLLLII